MSTGTERRVGRVLRVLAAVVTLPPAVLHEATHAVLAAPYARELAVVVEPAGARAMVGIDWREGVPGWAIWLAAYGPTVLGAMVGGVGAVWLVVGGPASARTWLLSGVLAVWWAIYMYPSREDRRVGGRI